MLQGANLHGGIQFGTEQSNGEVTLLMRFHCIRTNVKAMSVSVVGAR